MLTRTAIAISGALLVVACSCSSGHSTAQPPATPTTAKRRPPVTRPAKVTTFPVTPTTSGTTVPAPPSLADLVLGTAPPGFVQQADNVADTGPTNLAKAVDDDVSREARQALLSAGFEAGYQRQWTSLDAVGNTTQDFVFLYRFATPAGAQAYVQHWRLDLLTTGQTAPVQSFSPPFIPGAIGLSVVDKKQGSTGAVLFAKGQYAVQALVSSALSVDESGAVSEMAFAQYQRLP